MSDTHFGAWTGEDLLRHDRELALLAAHLDGVEVDVRYPTYIVGEVLCTHGHYLDYHAHRDGSLPNRLLGPCAVVDRHRRRAVARQREQRDVSVSASAPGSIRRAFSATSRTSAASATAGRRADRSVVVAQRSTGWPVSWRRPIRPSRALDAIARVVRNLGWAHDTDKIVFAHTHQPLADVSPRTPARVRYWNTGSWIYEPDLSSHQAYLRKAWPRTAVLIDSDEPAPRLLGIRKHLSPLERSQAPV